MTISPIEAIKNITEHQQQLDADGCMVGVSRQALDETLAFVSRLQELADFHFNGTPLPEKAQLYLTGISALGQKFMEETNATTFKASATLPHIESGKKYKAVFTLEEVK